MKTLLTSWLLILVVAGCASTAPKDKDQPSIFEQYAAEKKLESIDKITVFKFHGWRELDSKHLIISSAINKPYFITLKSRCIELKFTFSIGIDSFGSSLHAGTDSIFVPSFPHQKCFIKSIHKLTPEQANEMTQLRKKSRREESQ